MKKAKNKSESLKANDEKILHSHDIIECENALKSGKQNSESMTAKEWELVSNHIPLNYYIGSKKLLFKVLHWYYTSIKEADPFLYLPKTYHIPSGRPGIEAYK